MDGDSRLEVYAINTGKREKKRFILCFPKHNYIFISLFQIVEENW